MGGKCCCTFISSDVIYNRVICILKDKTISFFERKNILSTVYIGNRHLLVHLQAQTLCTNLDLGLYTPS